MCPVLHSSQWQHLPMKWKDNWPGHPKNKVSVLLPKPLLSLQRRDFTVGEPVSSFRLRVISSQVSTEDAPGGGCWSSQPTKAPSSAGQRPPLGVPLMTRASLGHHSKTRWEGPQNYRGHFSKHIPPLPSFSEGRLQALQFMSPGPCTLVHTPASPAHLAVLRKTGRR